MQAIMFTEVEIFCFGEKACQVSGAVDFWWAKPQAESPQKLNRNTLDLHKEDGFAKLACLPCDRVHIEMQATSPERCTSPWQTSSRAARRLDLNYMDSVRRGLGPLPFSLQVFSYRH